MDTDCVRLFVLAAEKLNISAAGRELGLAPAVASARLAKLEKLLGAELLHRSTRKVMLSLEGAEFLPFAKEMLAQEQAGMAALGHGNPRITGTLRFAAPSSFAQLYIAPILPIFLERHPGLSLDLRFADTPFDLLAGSFDLALRSAKLADSSLKVRKLADDERVLCASPSYLDEHGTPKHPADLVNHQLIGFGQQTAIDLIGPEGRLGQFDPSAATCRVTVDDGVSQKMMTLAGAGISRNSIWLIHRELDEGRLVRVIPEYRVDDLSALWLVYPKSNVLTAKVRIFIDFLIEQIGKSPAWLTK